LLSAVNMEGFCLNRTQTEPGLGMPWTLFTATPNRKHRIRRFAAARLHDSLSAALSFIPRCLSELPSLLDKTTLCHWIHTACIWVSLNRTRIEKILSMTRSDSRRRPKSSLGEFRASSLFEILMKQQAHGREKSSALDWFHSDARSSIGGTLLHRNH
jgi:hypothetical protein